MEKITEEQAQKNKQQLRLIGLEALRQRALNCEKCSLASTRTQVVFGHGDINSRLLFLGEAPGAEEDQQGKPFVGRSGKLLTNMIKAMGFDREQVYITNGVKCRPPENRRPTPEESSSCSDFIQGEIAIINPKVIITLGASATEAILGPGEGITKRRGKVSKYNDISVIPTFHPSYLLRNPKAKDIVVEDLKLAKEILKE